MKEPETQFATLTRGKISLEALVEDIAEFAASQPRRFYKIIIGADSDAADPASIVTAVTVWRVGNGAVHFWTKSPSRHFGSMRERVIAEAMSSITLAQELRGRLQERLGEEFFWDGNEVHVDIGANGPTRDLIDSVVGMIKGYNFTPVIKPYAFGASVVADRHT